MFQVFKGNSLGLSYVDPFTEIINGPEGQALFDGSNLQHIVVTRAPGRLDVMGGNADYSGSLVLEMPIAEATFAATQRFGYVAHRESGSGT